MILEDATYAMAERDELCLPRRVPCILVHATRDLRVHEVQKLALVREVRVERHGRCAKEPRDGSDGQPVHSVSVGDREGSIHYPLAGGGSARSLRPRHGCSSENPLSTPPEMASDSHQLVQSPLAVREDESRYPDAGSGVDCRKRPHAVDA